MRAAPTRPAGPYAQAMPESLGDRRRLVGPARSPGAPVDLLQREHVGVRGCGTP